MEGEIQGDIQARKVIIKYLHEIRRGICHNHKWERREKKRKRWEVGEWEWGRLARAKIVFCVRRAPLHDPGCSPEFFFLTHMYVYTYVHILGCVRSQLWHVGSFIVGCGLSCPTACGILVPWLGIEPDSVQSPALHGGFFTPGPPGKFQPLILK